VDKLDRKRRSENMRRIRSKNMAPEVAVRSLVHQLGFRFGLHSTALPGSPDLVLKRHKKIVFVHGCFWHQHKKCREGRVPSSRREYWVPKLARNQARDAANISKLRRQGWRCLVVWECELKDAAILNRLATFLAS
jgi:DNA mismatch endonuclease, patch repair protein